MKRIIKPLAIILLILSVQSCIVCRTTPIEDDSRIEKNDSAPIHLNDQP